jgi:hypothetical protein
VYVRDRVAGTTEQVSVDTGARFGGSFVDSISADGRYVAFHALGGDYGDWALFVRDRVAGTTEPVAGAEGDQRAGTKFVGVLSADGRLLVLHPHPSNRQDVLLRDRVSGTTEEISVPSIPARTGTIVLRPRPPRTGRALTAAMPIMAGNASVTEATVICKATIDGRSVPLRNRSFRAGAARCTWTLPTRSSGKVIRGSVRAITPNGIVARGFRAPIS